jgi:hypothetical protein
MAPTSRMPDGQTERGLQSPCADVEQRSARAVSRCDPENGPVYDLIDRI